MIDILVPVLGRPQNVKPLIESIETATRVAHRTFFICSPGDTEEIKACEAESRAITLITDWRPGRADFAKKINWAFPQTNAPWVFQGADDLRFHRGWDTLALETAKKKRAGVIGTDDMGNPLVKRGAHSTHTLIKRAYIEKYGGTIDDTGLVFCELYDHEFVDNEFVQTAMRRGQWAFSRRSKVEHLHPIWKKSEIDDTYKKAFRSSKPDFRLFQRRMRPDSRAERKKLYILNQAIRREAKMEARLRRNEERKSSK